MKITKRVFGHMPDGRPVQEFRMENDAGMACNIVEFGAIIRTLEVPGKQGTVDVVLGQENLETLLNQPAYNAIVVGRHANRIANGRFVIDGKTTQMETRNNATVCHSGRGNYGRRLFSGECKEFSDRVQVNLHLHEYGEGGLPGEADALVCYTLTNDNTLTIDYAISCSEPSPVNPTNHAFFNLNGHKSTDLSNLTVWCDADFYCPTDRTGLPTGEVRFVEGTPFDFRAEPCLRDCMAQIGQDPQLTQADGYDHNLCINGRGYRKACACACEDTGIRMEVWTDMPGVQIYTANWPTHCGGKDEAAYGPHGSICFETQFYPNASGYSQFPSCIVYPGETQHSRTAFRFVKP